MIYLDANATTPIFPQVLHKMEEIYRLGVVNPSSVHQAGKLAKRYYMQAKSDILSALNAGNEYDVVFCASGTEANNLALNAKMVGISTIEHESIKNQATDIYPNLHHKCVSVEIGVNCDGVVNIEDFASSAQKNECVSIIWANNLTGVIQNAGELIKHKGDAFLHMDAVQYTGKQLIDLTKTPIDAISISGHKIHGPHGCGALIFRKNFPISPLIKGGSQENNHRAGTHNLPAIVGLAKALRICNSVEYIQQYINHTQKLRNFITTFISQNGGTIVSSGAECLSNTICIIKNGVPSTEQLMFMDMNNICVSGGSACSAGVVGKSHVLQAMGLESLAPFAIRVSFDSSNTMDDVSTFCNVWKML